MMGGVDHVCSEKKTTSLDAHRYVVLKVLGHSSTSELGVDPLLNSRAVKFRSSTMNSDAYTSFVNCLQ